MSFTRRKALGLLGSAVAAPFIIRVSEAHAAVRIVGIGNPVAVGARQAGGKLKPALAAFPRENDGFMATWLVVREGATSAFVRYFANDGEAISPIVRMGGAGPTDGEPAESVTPVPLPDGSALVAFSAPGERAGRPNPLDVFVQRMSKAHAKDGRPILVNTNSIGEDRGVVAARIANGDVAVGWWSNDPVGSADNAFVRIVRPGGATPLPQRPLTAQTARELFPTSIAALPGGESVVAYVEQSQSGGPQNVKLQRLGPTGARLGAPIALKTTPFFESFGTAGVAARKGGGFQTVFFRQIDEQRARLVLRTFKESGAADDEHIVGTQPTKAFSNEPPRLALTSNGQVVVLTDGPAGAPSVMAWLVAPGGQRLAGPTVLRRRDGGVLTATSVTRLANGQFVAAWMEGTGLPDDSRALFQRFRIA